MKQESPSFKKGSVKLESVLSDESWLDLCEELIEEIHTLSAQLKLQNENDTQRLEVVETYVGALTADGYEIHGSEMMNH